MLNALVQYFDGGKPTVEGMKKFATYENRIAALEAKLTAIAAISSPSGGATVDTEARTAIDDIISGAGT